MLGALGRPLPLQCVAEHGLGGVVIALAQEYAAQVPSDPDCLYVVGAIHTALRGEHVPVEWFRLGKAARPA